MEKAATQKSAPPSKSAWNSDTGQFVTVRGAGTLKGQLKLRKGVDLTKPIAAQALKGHASNNIRKG
jgi:hypothetical protein